MSEAVRRLAPVTLPADARRQAQMLRALSYVGLFTLAFIILIPFFWMLSTSFKPARGIFVMPPQWIPNPFILDHYFTIWEKTHLARGLVNSTFIALSTTVGEIATSTLAGFAFARMRFPAKGPLFGLLLMTMMIPGIVTLIPTFILFGELDWIDTFNPVILPYLLGTPFALFLSRQFFSGLPRELEDAAKVDGASFFQIYRHVFMPQARPLVATLFVLGYLHRWNDFLAPLIYLRSPEIQTVSVMLARLVDFYVQDWSVLMAGAMIALLPILIIFVVLQRFIIESVAFSGLKG